MRNNIKLKISKSSRHSKITGDFFERLVMYLLSKYGFECVYVDHTGIDIIATNPYTEEVMGISVKSRSRNEGKEGQYVNIPNENFDKVDAACEKFNCKPYFAITIDQADNILVFILSKGELLELHPRGQRCSAWTMGRRRMQEYYKNKNIMIFEFEYRVHNWWGGND